jgi:TPR repeat protein
MATEKPQTITPSSSQAQETPIDPSLDTTPLTEDFDEFPDPVAALRNKIIETEKPSLWGSLTGDTKKDYAEIKDHAAAIKKDPINSIKSLFKQNKYINLKNYILDGTITLKNFLELGTDIVDNKEKNYAAEIDTVFKLLLKEKECYPLVYTFLCSETLSPSLKKDYTLEERSRTYSQYWRQYPNQRIKLNIIYTIANYSDFKEQFGDYVMALEPSAELIVNLEKAICDDPGPQNLLGELFYQDRVNFSIGKIGVKLDQTVPSVYTSCTLQKVFYHYSFLTYPHGSKESILTSYNMNIPYSNFFNKGTYGTLWRASDDFSQVRKNILINIGKRYQSDVSISKSESKTQSPQLESKSSPNFVSATPLPASSNSSQISSNAITPEEIVCIKGFKLYGKGELKTAYEHFQNAARNNYPAAFVFLGLFHERGYGGVKKSLGNANVFYGLAREHQEWFLGLEKTDNEYYKLFYCFYYDYADKTKKDSKKVAGIYRALAEKQNAFGQYRLGICYQNGDGVEKNDAEKLRLVTLAAYKNLPLAQYNAGIFFRPKNPQESFNWFITAARQGHALAQYEVALNYQASKNKECVRWFQAAAEQGVAEAQAMLGWFYSNGEFVTKDEGRAFAWYLAAAEQGNVVAQNNIGLYFRKNDQHRTAFNWFSQAAEQGDATALYNLAECYEKGWGVDPDLPRALSLYQQSATKNDKDAPAKVASLEKNAATFFSPKPNESKEFPMTQPKENNDKPAGITTESQGPTH